MSNILRSGRQVDRHSPEMFQLKMNDLFHGFEFICAYIDALLILTKVDWTALRQLCGLVSV